ncbi:MAG: hypothetical protein K0R50_1212 [Eubacterium sp.]|nr:hypothetical protein [Eubacterium sp.]
MDKNKNKDSNNDVSFDNDQLGENKNNNGGGKKGGTGKPKPTNRIM